VDGHEHRERKTPQAAEARRAVTGQGGAGGGVLGAALRSRAAHALASAARSGGDALARPARRSP